MLANITHLSYQNSWDSPLIGLGPNSLMTPVFPKNIPREPSNIALFNRIFCNGGNAWFDTYAKNHSSH